MKKIEIDSRLVEKGDIFVAIPCEKEGRNIEEAINRGASIVVTSSSNESLGDLHTNDPRLLASKLAAFCYSSQPEVCVAVTGTNGKSSVVNFLSEILRKNGIKEAYLGTNGLYVQGEKEKEASLTTPDSVTLHRILTDIKENYNIDYFVFEASSHALHQKRLHSVILKTAAFTNLASDHLDYHKTKEGYFLSKQKIFTEIGAENSVFSRDDLFVWETLTCLPHNNVITFGFSKDNDVYAENINELNDKIIFDLNINGEIFSNLNVNFLGNFQLSNLLCSIAIAVSLGLKNGDIVNVLERIKALEGRMEYVAASPNGGKVYIDFAHTEEAFYKVLLSFKKVCKGRLIVIFGCGGDRDKSKRPLFGKIAEKFGDINIITDDNPRTEDPSSIRKEIMRECKTAIEIPDRKEAIEYGISLLKQDDFLVILGKGHEIKQIYNDLIIERSDKRIVLEYLGKFEGL